MLEHLSLLQGGKEPNSDDKWDGLIFFSSDKRLVASGGAAPGSQRDVQHTHQKIALDQPTLSP